MITDKQVQQIIDRVEQSALENQYLKDDLVDHLSCLVEIEMKKGSAFNEALEKAFHQTAPNGLNEIQQETIFLLNYTKIMFMKRLTYSLGFMFSVIWFTGIFFKVLHFPGATVLLFGGGAGIAFVFVPLLLINRYKQLMTSVLSERMKWLMGSASIILFMVASFFKLMHLMGAVVLLAASFMVFTLGFLPFLFFRMYKKSLEEI